MVCAQLIQNSNVLYSRFNLRIIHQTMTNSILIIVAVTFATLSAFTQIPNNSFENWASTGSYNNPDSWYNLNGMTVYNCTQSTGNSEN